MPQNQGVAFGPGCQPSASAANASSQSGIPNAEMLGRFVMQYDEGAAGFFVDADDAQEVALAVKAALALPAAIMDEVHADLSIPTDVACKVYAAIKRASASGMETRQGGDGEAAPSRSYDSPARDSEDAQQPPND